jgi:hypothetical protein
MAVNSSSKRTHNRDSRARVRVFLYYRGGQRRWDAVRGRVYRYDWNPAGTGSLVNPQLILDLPVCGTKPRRQDVAFDSAGRLHAVIGDLNNGRPRTTQAAALRRHGRDPAESTPTAPRVRQ